jgi:APA family basic amino acid/polyamine antiporter
MVPVAGSAYTYAYATVGEIFAWIIGWDLILEYALSTATVAVGWSGYFVSLTPRSGSHHSAGAVDAAVQRARDPDRDRRRPRLLIVGIKESPDANTVLVAIKSLVLVVFVVAGASYVKRANLTPFIPRIPGRSGASGGAASCAAPASCSSPTSASTRCPTAAQEAKNPARDMPVGILGSLGICTVMLRHGRDRAAGIVPYAQLNVADPLAVGIDATGLTWLRPVIKVAALFGLFSTMLVTLLAQTRIFYSMSRDGLLPRAFSSVHPRFRTPHVSTMLTGSIIALAAGLTPITVLSQLVSIGTLLAFVLVCIGVIVLRRTAPDAPRPFRTPAVPAVPIAGAAICLAQMIGLPLATWERLFIWLALGLVVYLTFGRRHSLTSLTEIDSRAPVV